MSAAPEQPKKVTGGAFGRFLAANRPALQKELAGKPGSEVTKLASQRFKAISEDERSEWEKKYKDAQAQHEKDMEAFLAAGGEKKAVKRKSGKEDEESPKKKAKKDPEAPKKPVGGAYGRFLAKNREAFTKECEGKPVTAISKLAGERWKELSAEQKEPFEEEYKAKVASYQEAMKTYTPPASAPEDEESPPKVATKKSPKESPPKVSRATPKRSATSAKKAATSESSPFRLEDKGAAQAEKDGLTTTLLKLVAHKDVIDSGKSQNAILQALQESKGLLHPARRALLGA